MENYVSLINNSKIKSINDEIKIKGGLDDFKSW